jgi:osmotically inducible protein OsmC
MTIRNAEAEWQGSLKTGAGRVKLGSGAFEGAYSFPSRFENGPGTNPEELIAAAYAACFSMALCALLEREGFAAPRIRTVAKVHLGLTPAGPTLTRIDLATEGAVAGLYADDFARHAETAKHGCLVSRALATVPDIRLQATLVAEPV